MFWGKKWQKAKTREKRKKSIGKKSKNFIVQAQKSLCKKIVLVKNIAGKPNLYDNKKLCFQKNLPQKEFGIFFGFLNHT